MLTSMFYFNYYKPYLIKEADTFTSAGQKSRLSFYGKNAHGKQSVLLNKAYRNDIIEYAGSLSKKMVDFKDISRLVVQTLKEFGNNISNDNVDKAKHIIAEDIEEFVESYNSAATFAFSQDHSAKLRNFAIEQASLIKNNRNVLKPLGITMTDNGTLGYDGEKIGGVSISKLNDTIDSASRVFDEIYENAREFLTYPLSNHMNFKGLGYYYNYKLGTVQDDTFRIIKSGILVDIAI